MNFKRLILILVVSSALVSTFAQANTHEEPHWSYEGEAAKWGMLNPKWSICSKGQNQSPIDINETVNVNTSEMRTKFEPAKLKNTHTQIADVIHNGHTVQVNYLEGDKLTIGEEQFQLLQHHFHSPSEHTIQGKHFPMEMHLVHKSADGDLAVIGVFIEKGNHNAAFDPIWANLPKSEGVKNPLKNVSVDVSSLLPSGKAIFRYDGSLTTPACSEGVKWIIMKNPIQLSVKQIEAFQAIINGNNRPVQPQNGRPVVADSIE